MQTLNKQTFKTMIQMTLALALAIWSTGCGPTTLQKTQFEERRMKVQASIDSAVEEARDRSAKAKYAFLHCIEVYAIKNARTSASPSEVQMPRFHNVKSSSAHTDGNDRNYHWSMASIYGLSSFKDWIRQETKVRKKPARCSRVSRRGEELAIRAVIEMRQ